MYSSETSLWWISSVCHFQGDVRIHMIYKSARRDAGIDILNGEISAEAMNFVYKWIILFLKRS